MRSNSITVSALIFVVLVVLFLSSAFPVNGTEAVRVRIKGMPRNHNSTKSMVCPPGSLPCDNDCIWNLTISAEIVAKEGISGVVGRVDFDDEPLTFDPPLSPCGEGSVTRTTVSLTRDFTVACPGTHNGCNEGSFFIDFSAYGCDGGYGYEFMRLKLKCYYCSNDSFVAVDGNGTTEIVFADHDRNLIIQFSVLNLDENTNTVNLTPTPSAPWPYYPAFPPSIVLGPGESQEFLVTVIVPEGMPAGAENIFTLNADAVNGLWVSDSDTIIVTEYTDTDEDIAIPSVFDLHQNYPNPFNPVTEIMYDLKADCHVSLEIYDSLGRKLTTLVAERQSAGRKTVQWNGTDSGGSALASGTYFCRLEACGYVETKKVILLK